MHILYAYIMYRYTLLFSYGMAHVYIMSMFVCIVGVYCMCVLYVGKRPQGNGPQSEIMCKADMHVSICEMCIYYM